ncbi:MAG: glycosyltransferase, partial [Alphaproteobacteria bacterium]
DGLARRERWRRRLARRFTHQFVALGEDLKRFLVADIGADPRRIAILYNGVDCTRFHPPADAAEKARARAALAAYAAEPVAGRIADPQTILIGSVGRLDPVKDYDRLIAALAGLADPWRKQVAGVLIGDGPERLRLEELAREAGLGGRFLVTGRASDTAELLRAFDIFVLPSRFEGLSNALLEAMATGLPIVATAVGGTPELVTAGVSAELVPPADEMALKDALVGLLADPARRTALGRHALERAQGRFSVDAFVASYAALYESLAPAAQK